MKQYCTVHHLYYNGSVCPFCQSEYYERLERSNNKKPSVKKPLNKKDDKPIEITDDVLSKLQNHFKK